MQDLTAIGITALILGVAALGVWIAS